MTAVLILYTLGFLLVFGSLNLLLRLGLLPLGTLAAIPSFICYPIWWAFYVGGVLAIRWAISEGAPSLLRLRSKEWHAQWNSTERLLRPPYLGWFDAIVEFVLVATLLALVLTGQGDAWLVFMFSVAILVYGIAIRENRRAMTEVSPVMELTAGSGPDARQITLQWKNPDDLSFSGVSVRRGIGAPPAQIDEGEEVYRGFDESQRDEPCEPGVILHYAVFSLKELGLPGARNTVTGSAFPLPPDPLNPAWQAGEHEIELRWEMPQIPGIHEVIVQRRTDRFPASREDGERIYQGAQTWCRDSNLQPAAAHFYRLFAVDVYGQTSPGIDVEAATRAPSVSDLHIRLDRGNVRLSWVNPAQPQPGITIVRKVGADPESPNDGDAWEIEGASWTDYGVAYSTTFHYGVYTRYPHAIYGEGKLCHITTPPPPQPIQDLEAIPRRTRVELRWRRPVDRSWAGVIIRRTRGQAARTPEDGDWVCEDSGEQTVDLRLEPGTEYIYTAFSYDGVGHYNPTGRSIQVRTLPPPQPVNFNLPQIDATTRQVILSWIRTDPSAPFVHLRRWQDQPPATLNYLERGGNLLCQRDEIRYVDRDLLAGNKYYYVTYAVDREGSASQGVMHEVRTPPSWNIQVVLFDRVANVRPRISLPESIPLVRVLPELLRRLGRGAVANLRLHNQTQNFDYNLGGSLLDHRTQPGDEVVLEYEQQPAGA